MQGSPASGSAGSGSPGASGAAPELTAPPQDASLAIVEANAATPAAPASADAANTDAASADTLVAISVRGISKMYRRGPDGGPSVLGYLAAAARRLRGASEPPAQESFWALDDISFEIRHGERVGLVGRNGAGKSTLLKILSRVAYPTTGEIWIRGRLTSLLEVGTGFHPDLTGRENVYLNGAIRGLRRSEIEERFASIIDFAEVEGFIDTPVKRYSSGMQVRLAFSVAAHLEPEILLLDEVFAVGDIAFQRKCMARIDELVSNGRTLMFVSHSLETVRSLCERVIWIEGGRLKADGPADVVLAEYIDSLNAAPAES